MSSVEGVGSKNGEGERDREERRGERERRVRILLERGEETERCWRRGRWASWRMSDDDETIGCTLRWDSVVDEKMLGVCRRARLSSVSPCMLLNAIRIMSSAVFFPSTLESSSSTRHSNRLT